MTQINLSTKLPASASRVWELVGGFNALPDWHPAIEKSELSENGRVRTLTLADGARLVERLQKHDDRSRSYSYAIAASPLPIADYSATIRIRDAGAEGCVMEWSGSFEPHGVPEAEARQAITAIYESGFESLRRMFGG
jgi:hypothetical protein